MVVTGVGGGGLIQVPALLILLPDTPIATLFGTTQALYERIKDRMPASYHQLPGQHYDLYRGEGYRQALALEIEWLLEHLPSAPR